MLSYAQTHMHQWSAGSPNNQLLGRLSAHARNEAAAGDGRAANDRTVRKARYALALAGQRPELACAVIPPTEEHAASQAD